MKRYLITLSIVIFIILSVSIFYFIQLTPPQDNQINRDYAIKQGMAYLTEQVHPDGSFGDQISTDWIAFAIGSTSDDLSRWSKTKDYLLLSTDALNLSNITDLERHTLALLSFQLDPLDIQGKNLLISIIDQFDGEQIGDKNDIYDDIFGVIALRSSGILKNATIIKNSSRYIKQMQDENGGWGDVDTTAAAITALIAGGEENTSNVLYKAKTYLKTMQRENGGFYSWGSTNIASTAWVICCIESLKEEPCSDYWSVNSTSPIDFIMSLQQSDGSFNYTKDREMNPEWMTAYALLALSEQSFLREKYE